jgi:hypothetical protein
MYSLFSELRGLSPNFHIHVSVTDIYKFPGLVHLFPAAEMADRSWEYINRSQTHEFGTGLWPRHSFSGNICFEFSVLVLCSVYPQICNFMGLPQVSNFCAPYRFLLKHHPKPFILQTHG